MAFEVSSEPTGPSSNVNAIIGFSGSIHEISNFSYINAPSCIYSGVAVGSGTSVGATVAVGAIVAVGATVGLAGIGVTASVGAGVATFLAALTTTLHVNFLPAYFLLVNFAYIFAVPLDFALTTPSVIVWQQISYKNLYYLTFMVRSANN